MFKKLSLIITISLVVVHFIILYFWMVDWEKLVTEIGLICWIGSIVLGVIAFLVYRKLNLSDKSIMVIKRVIFSSTLMTIFLGALAIFIELTTSSMP
ncbi:hypothetical protein [Sediminibacillus halophilus]|uniref:Uncharacterized protein n=1 Tax=Sediminibacillus halophilus TaxID=482461 RepID=A0A1G9V6B0_9BACI|nr:hypothetical protein [Sediminibacillus halophilus]SDM67689.1 hypothetical protein SAMN05216244_3150 [Sediminibacillus halophilus]